MKSLIALAAIVVVLVAVVTWSMAGRNNFVAKAVQLVMDMDKMIGGNFEKGLRDMKAVVEAQQSGRSKG